MDDLKQRLFERLDKNLSNYHQNLMGLEKAEIIEMADRAALMAEVHGHLTKDYEFAPGEVAYLLNLQNPLIRAMALSGVESTKPVAVMFGTVLAAEPLQIDVEQKMILGSAQLRLCRAVTDHTVEMTVDHETEEATHGHPATAEATEGSVTVAVEVVNHLHICVGRKAFTVHGALQPGEKVLLLRMQGGQFFSWWIGCEKLLSTGSPLIYGVVRGIVSSDITIDIQT